MRKQLAVLAAVFVFALAGHAGTAEARGSVYRAVAIDTSRIAATGHRHLAGALKPMLAAELSKALGPRLGHRGGVITVRITRIDLGPYGGPDNGQGQIDDQIWGTIVVPGRAAIPIRIALPPDTGGAWYASNVDERRVYRLIQALAAWTAREI